MLPLFAIALSLAVPKVEMATVRAVLAEAGPITTGGHSVGARVRCLVGPDGRFLSCQIVSLAGDPARAELLLHSFERQRIVPAHDGSGTKMHGYIETDLWATAGDKPPPSLPQLPSRAPVLQLSVARLPAGLTSPLNVPLIAMIDATGKMLTCEAPNANQALVNVACQRLSDAQYPIVRDKKGVAVSYLTTLGVRVATSGS